MRRFLVIIPIFLFVLLGACSNTRGGEIDPTIGAFVAQTQTATMWTPAPITPTPSVAPKQALIVKALNDEFQKQADPLEETLDAKFSIIDIGFDLSGSPPATTTMQVHVECEWISRPSCTEARAFIVFARAFKGVKPGVRQKIIEQVPETVLIVQIRAFDHMNEIGIIEITWECLLSFANDEITGEQLAARTIRFQLPP